MISLWIQHTKERGKRFFNEWQLKTAQDCFYECSACKEGALFAAMLNNMFNVVDIPLNLAIKYGVCIHENVNILNRFIVYYMGNNSTIFYFFWSLCSSLLSYLHLIPENLHYNNVQNLKMLCHDLSCVPCNRANIIWKFNYISILLITSAVLFLLLISVWNFYCACCKILWRTVSV